MVIDNKYNIGDIVYIVTDVDQLPCMVTSLEVTSKDVLYHVSRNGLNTVMYDMELSKEKEHSLHL
jgi:uncharacterized phosphosugar-binding protein